MSKTTLQLRRGTQSENSTFTGALGEVIVDTTRKTLVVHDGVTAGGSALATIASPALTGIPTVPTATAGTNTTQAASTAFVQAALAGFTSGPTNSDDLTEGTSHLFFSKDRVKNALTAGGNISITQPGGAGTNVVISYTQPTNISAFTNDAGYLTTANIRSNISATGSINYDPGTGIFSYTEAIHTVNGLTGNVVLTTDTVAEGSTNQYFTPSRVRSSVTGTGGITYTQSSGTFALTNTAVTINGTSVALGASATVTAAANTLTGNTLASNVVSSSLTSVGTLNQLSIAVGSGTSSNQGALTVGTQNFNDIDILASFVSTNNNYNQVTVQNLSSGNLASANFVAYNNQGTAGSNYLAMGINSSTYNGGGVFGSGSLNAASASFLISASTDLAIGTFATKSIRFVVNTSTTDQMTIDGTSGYIGVNNMTPAYRLDVNGDVNITGALRTGGSAGTAGYVLQSNGTTAPSWVNIGASLPNITELDSWGTKINGGTYAFTPTNNGLPVSIGAPIQLLMCKNGQYLKGWLNTTRPVWNTMTKYGDYTINGSGQVVFYSPPQVGDVISAVVLVGNTSNPIVTKSFSAFDIMTGT